MSEWANKAFESNLDDKEMVEHLERLHYREKLLRMEIQRLRQCADEWEIEANKWRTEAESVQAEAGENSDD